MVVCKPSVRNDSAVQASATLGMLQVPPRLNCCCTAHNTIENCILMTITANELHADTNYRLVQLPDK